MKRFVEGLGRGQSTLFPSSLDDYVSEDNPVRVVDVFVDSVNLEKLGFLASNHSRLAGPAITLALCSSSTSTAILTEFGSRADVSSGNANAISS
jgi:hypothetical protein